MWATQPEFWSHWKDSTFSQHLSWTICQTKASSPPWQTLSADLPWHAVAGFCSASYNDSKIGGLHVLNVNFLLVSRSSERILALKVSELNFGFSIIGLDKLLQHPLAPFIAFRQEYSRVYQRNSYWLYHTATCIPSVSGATGAVSFCTRKRNGKTFRVVPGCSTIVGNGCKGIPSWPAILAVLGSAHRSSPIPFLPETEKKGKAQTNDAQLPAEFSSLLLGLFLAYTSGASQCYRFTTISEYCTSSSYLQFHTAITVIELMITLSGVPCWLDTDYKIYHASNAQDLHPDSSEHLVVPLQWCQDLSTPIHSLWQPEGNTPDWLYNPRVNQTPSLHRYATLMQ